jgi:hypothetical protein
MQAQRLMRPSAWLMGMADAFVKDKFGNEPYVVLHIRPYPDMCTLVSRQGVGVCVCVGGGWGVSCKE